MKLREEVKKTLTMKCVRSMGYKMETGHRRPKDRPDTAEWNIS